MAFCDSKMMIEMFKNESLRKHTFYGVGGPADELYYVKDINALGEIWAESITENVPKIILGQGSNLLFSDRGFRGRIFILKFNKMIWRDNFLIIETGKLLQEIIEETNKEGFSDLCDLSGIPGNLGGAIRGNAGAFGSEIQHFIKSVEFLDESGIIQTFSQKQCEFGYRESIFKRNPNWCIVRATIELNKKEDSNKALQKTKELLINRWKKYPKGKSGGSFFKNPDHGFAGELLEKSGAKGDRIGHAQIAEEHANFIINVDGKALQQDILKLARKWRDLVKEKHEVELKPEIFICDEYGKRIEL